MKNILNIYKEKIIFIIVAIMLDKIFFHELLKSYYDTNKNDVTIDSFDQYIKDYDFSDEFHNCNKNGIIGDIFEYVAKYYFISKNCETYFINEIPLRLRKKLKIKTKKDTGIDLTYKFNDDWIGVQCKWRSNINECIDKNSIAGFKEALNRTKLNYGFVL